MNFLRRGSRPSAEASGGAGGSDDAVVTVGGAEGTRAHTPGKGRPTPSRRQAEGKKRGPVAPAPRTQREALKRAKHLRCTRAERRRAGDERRARMQAGDDSVLPARDRGPVRAHVRDIVDSRRNLMGLFMPLAVLVFVTVIIPDRTVQGLGSTLCLVVLAAMALEGVLLGRFVVGRVRERFPDDRSRGLSLGWYACTRATQIRRLRMPKPRVARGEAVG